VELVPANSEAERIGLRKGDTILRLGEGSFYESRKRILDGTHTPGKMVPIVWKSEGEGPIKFRNYTLQAVPALSVAELILFLSRDDQWILFDQKGKYDSSPAGERYVGWHVNQQREEAALFFPVDRFRDQLYRPRELSDRLADMGVTVPDGLSQDASVHHESATPDFTSREDFEQYLPPRVRIISPEDRSVKNDAECQIRVEITTRSTLPIRSVVFRVNGIQPATRHRVITENVIGDEIALVVEQTVALSPGDNDLRINAAHERAVSNEQHLLLRRQGGETATRTDLPTLYVLAIGVSDYKNDDFDLRFAHKDASDFVEAWKRQQGLSYLKVESLLVTNREATTAKIRSAMKWLTDKTKNAPDGFAVVMFSGHGLFDEFDGWHFGAHDLDPQDLSNTSIPSVEIFDWLNRRVRCRKIVFADTCHAGAIPGNGFLFGRAVNRDGKDYWRGYGDIYLLASQPTEPSREDVAWQNGAYTEALLIALTSPKADTDHNGQLGLLELATFAEQETRRLTNHQQNPTVGIPPTVSIPMIATVSQQK
ncbi:MAG: caspase family protein, partial [Planctomycetales bacterium]|nr:caspase family protein [Planctomycetales bacterium]